MTNKEYLSHSYIWKPLLRVVFIGAVVVSGLAEAAQNAAVKSALSTMPSGLSDSWPEGNEVKGTKTLSEAQERASKIALANPKLSRLLVAEISKREGYRISNKSTGVEVNYTGTPLVHFENNSVQVYVELNQISDNVVNILEQYGLRVEVVNKRLKQVQGWVDVGNMDAISDISEVVKVTHPKYGTVNNTGVQTEGDAISKANALRELGYTGKGVRVGILSDGANNWRAASKSGNLPESITVYGTCSIGVNNPNQCRSAGTCNEGTAMAEIIHDIAPDAEIAVAAIRTSLEFIQALDTLANDFRAHVIVDDIGFFAEPYFEDGPVAQAVSALPGRVLYVSAAGNRASTHYYSPRFSSAPFAGRPGIFHDFDDTPPGRFGGPEELFHGFIIPPKSGVFVIVQWDGRDDLPPRQTDLGLQGYDRIRQVAESNIDNNATQDFIEGVCVPNNSSASQVGFITLSSTLGNDPFKMFFLGASAIEHPVARGSIFGHPSVERALAVGAINASEPGNDDIAFYSSLGPSEFNIPVPHEQAGVFSRPRNKPDIVSIDGVSVSGAGGFTNQFFGTSAAAPHVAGVAALLMSVAPIVTAKNAKSALIRGAIDLGSPGFDFTYGYGRMDALRALGALRRGGALPAIIMLLDEEN